MTGLKPEERVQYALVQWFQMQYPRKLWFTNILSGGMYLTPRQGRKFKLLGAPRKFPDFYVDEPVGKYHGLRIEIKKDGERLKKRNGEWASEHIKEQSEMLERYRERGYYADFAIGFDQAKQIVEHYFANQL
jgi:hypothetical protein